MKTLKWTTAFAGLILVTAAAQAQMQTDTPAEVTTSETATTAGAGVRIVRLSQLVGEVKLDRNINRGFEAAFLNLPITQGARLITANGAAEVEFEDNSSLRMTPDTLIEFPVLSRDTAGNAASSVHVLHGTVFVSLSNGTKDVFALTSRESRLLVAPGSHLQFHVGTPHTLVAVYKGSVQAGYLTQKGPAAGQNDAGMQPASNLFTVTSKKTLLFDPANQAAPTLVGHIEKTAYDAWDKTQADYHAHYANAAFAGGTGLLYGSSDLNYYGAFSSAGGCGSLWRPYFSNSSFDPYANGSWAWYQGAGYSWVSPYPWGWTPYHSGAWQYCQSGAFWGWQPGSTFNGLSNGGLVRSLGKSPIRLRPPHAPRLGEATLVAVSEQPVTRSTLKDGNTFLFRNGSAGLGVPRETFGKLDHLSAQAGQHGSSTRSLGSSMMSSSSSGAAFSSTTGVVASRSSAPAMPSSSSAGMSHGAGAGGTSGGAHH